jgi:hypothetical protein
MNFTGLHKKERGFIMTQYASRQFTPYYAGFEIGSGNATLKLIPLDESLEMKEDLMYLPASFADGDIKKLINTRGNGEQTPLSTVIYRDEQEHAITFRKGNGEEYTFFLDGLMDAGTNKRSTAGDQKRYYSPQAQAFLLTMAADMIEQRSFELRLVTALPVKLFQNTENRRRVKECLEGYYRFMHNGVERECIVKVGTVIMEGQGVLIHDGDSELMQGVIDLGFRTLDLVGARGQRLLPPLCDGAEFGIGQIVDDLVQLAADNDAHLSIEDAQAVLYAWAHNDPLPEVNNGDGDAIPESVVRATIVEAKDRLWSSIASFISTTWNQEAAKAGSQFKKILLGGGGPYYYKAEFQQLLGKKAAQVEESEYSNVQGYADLASGLEDMKADVWAATRLNLVG